MIFASPTDWSRTRSWSLPTKERPRAWPSSWKRNYWCSSNRCRFSIGALSHSVFDVFLFFVFSSLHLSRELMCLAIFSVCSETFSIIYCWKHEIKKKKSFLNFKSCCLCCLCNRKKAWETRKSALWGSFLCLSSVLTLDEMMNWCYVIEMMTLTASTKTLEDARSINNFVV